MRPYREAFSIAFVMSTVRTLTVVTRKRRSMTLSLWSANHARQIDGTQFWAVMAIDPKTKRRFVRRLLEFIGCRDETVSAACRALGLTADSERPRLLGVA